VWAGSTILGRETILGYPTVASRFSARENRWVATWMAPVLGCFPLRINEEFQNLEGTAHLIVSSKQAIKVTVPALDR
jgi:hypothetical protein